VIDPVGGPPAEVAGIVALNVTGSDCNWIAVDAVKERTGVDLFTVSCTVFAAGVKSVASIGVKITNKL